MLTEAWFLPRLIVARRETNSGDSGWSCVTSIESTRVLLHQSFTRHFFMHTINFLLRHLKTLKQVISFPSDHISYIHAWGYKVYTNLVIFLLKADSKSGGQREEEKSNMILLLMFMNFFQSKTSNFCHTSY